jgi:hypothetical protein
VVFIHYFKRYLLGYLWFGFIRGAFPFQHGYYACFVMFAPLAAGSSMLPE